MAFFTGRRAALNVAATFPGIGAAAPQPAPAAAEPKGDGEDDGEMTAEEKEQAEKDRKRRAKNKAAGRDENDDGDPDENNCDDEGDDASDEDDMKKGGKAAAPRLRERARCAAIFAHPAAAGREDLAAQLAFGTSLPRSQAIAVLARAPKRSRLGERMAGQPAHGAGPGAAPMSAAERGRAIVSAAFDEVAITSRR